MLAVYLLSSISVSSLATNNECGDLVSPVKISQQAIYDLHEKIQARTEDHDNPYIESGFDEAAVAKVEGQLEKILEDYGTVRELSNQDRTFKRTEIQSIGQKILNQVTAIAENKNATSAELFAALETLRRLGEIYNRTDWAPKRRHQTEQDQDKTAEDGTETEEADGPGLNPPDIKPPTSDTGFEHNPDSGWQENPDTYIPGLSELKDGSSQAKVVVYETDAPVPSGRFATNYYEDIFPDRIASNRMIRPTIKKIGKAKTYTAKINFNGKSRVPLPLPKGTDFGSAKSASVKKKGEGEYLIHQGSSSTEEITLTDVSTAEYYFSSPHQEAANKRVTGLKQKDWPKAVLEFVQQIKREGIRNPLEIASRVEKFIIATYKYFSVGKGVDQKMLDEHRKKFKDYRDAGYPIPQAAAHTGMFNCDNAAWIMVSLLRDFFGVSARIVAGKTGRTTTINGKTVSVIETGTPGHAWVEVWNGKGWTEFDPTPILEPENGESNDEQSEEKDKKEEKGEKKEESKEKNEQKEESKEESEKTDKDSKDSKQNDPRKSKSEDSDELNRVPFDDAVYRLIFESIETQTLERALMDGNHLKVLAEGIDTIDKTMAQLGATQPGAAQAASVSKNRLLTEVSIRSSFSSHGLYLALAQIKAKVSQGEYRDAWQGLKNLEHSVSSIAALRKLDQKESALLAKIKRILDEFRAIRHEDSQRFDLAERILKQLPGNISRRWVQKHYGNVLKLGSPALHKFTDDLLKGKLNRLLEMIVLKEFGEMVLNSHALPAYGTEKGIYRSPVPRGKNDDLVIATDLVTDFPRMFFNPEAGKHILSDFVEGRQYALGTLETLIVPKSKNVVRRKMSEVYYDVSGSMDEPIPGANITAFQAQEALLRVFADLVGSDTLKGSEVPLHLADFLPFNDEVRHHHASKISNSAKALEFMTQGMAGRQNIWRWGTDITKAMVDFFERVAEAHKSQKGHKQIKEATLVLFSDGDDPHLNLSEIKKAQALLPPGVEVFVNFVAIGKRNATLELLANQSNYAAKKPMVKILTSEQIAVAGNPTHLLQLDPDAFAKEKELPPPSHIIRELNDLASQTQASRLSFKVDFGSELKEIQSGADTQSILSRFKTSAETQDAQSAINQLGKLTTIADKDLRARVASTVMRYYLKRASTIIKKLNLDEKKMLNSLENWIQSGG